MFKWSLSTGYREISRVLQHIRIVAVIAVNVFAISILVCCLSITLGCRKTEVISGKLVQNSKTILADQLTRLCWIAYSPTNFDPTTKPPRWPSEQDVREDLHTLRNAGFDGLVTYGSNYRQRSSPNQVLDIPKLAQAEGFAGMIVGVWNPADEDELKTAEQAAQYAVVVGYCVGNEGLDARYDLKTLTEAMDRLRQKTGKLVSTSEEIGDYYENSPLWKITDWTFPNAHPYFGTLAAKVRDYGHDLCVAKNC